MMMGVMPTVMSVPVLMYSSVQFPRFRILVFHADLLVPLNARLVTHVTQQLSLVSHNWCNNTKFRLNWVANTMLVLALHVNNVAVGLNAEQDISLATHSQRLDCKQISLQILACAQQAQSMIAWQNAMPFETIVLQRQQELSQNESR